MVGSNYDAGRMSSPVHSTDARTVVVTGASNGIGRAIALQLAARGAYVLLVGRDVGRLTEVKRAIEDAGGGAEAFRADLTKAADVVALVRAVRTRTRRLDALVHAAGVARAASGTAMPSAAGTASFDEHMALNARAPMELTGGLLDLVEHAQGIVVLVGSVAALRPAPGFASYAASKSAAKAWVDGLREEVAGRGVRFTAVHPGQVATDMQAAIYETRGDEYHPERLLQPDSVAALVSFAFDHPELEITELVVRSATSGYAARTR